MSGSNVVFCLRYVFSILFPPHFTEDDPVNIYSALMLKITSVFTRNSCKFNVHVHLVMYIRYWSLIVVMIELERVLDVYLE